MAKITREETSALEQTVTILIERSDYEAAFNKEINKHQKQSNLKGFRKGKVPVSYIKKIFGKQILADKINNVLSEQLDVVLKELQVFGDPLPNENWSAAELNPKDLQDYEFKFDLGLVPDIELKELDAPVQTYAFVVSEEEVQEKYGEMLTSLGTQQEVEDSIQYEDVVSVEVKELDGEVVKEGGHSSRLEIAVDLATDGLRQVLQQHKVGDTIRFNIHDVEDGASSEHIRKYVLGCEEDVEYGDMFEGEIVKVVRMVPAESNQKTFDEWFGKGEVSSEEEAKDSIRRHLEGHYASRTGAVGFDNYCKAMLKKQTFDMPEGFLRHWVKASEERSFTEEQLDVIMPYQLEGFRWNVIRGKLIEKYNLGVTAEELQQGFLKQLQKIYGTELDKNFHVYRQYIHSMMQNKDAVSAMGNQIIHNKLMEQVMAEIQAEPKIVDNKELNELEQAIVIREQEIQEKLKKAKNEQPQLQEETEG